MNSLLAMSLGLSAVCAHCEHYWSAADKQLPSCGQKCGGPMSGGAFDKYKGPITDFSQMCFVCSQPATYAIRAKNNPRVLGCCSPHIDVVKKYRPVDKPAVSITTISSDGIEQVKDSDLVPDKISIKLTNG